MPLGDNMGRKHKGKNKKNKKSINIRSGLSVSKSDICDVGGASASATSSALKEPLDNLSNEKDIKWFGKLVSVLREKQVFSKFFIACFALSIFSYAYFVVNSGYRSVLSYVGIMLTLVVTYIEILIVRDHLWVIEGSMPESKKWREVFFNPTSLKKQKFRKIFVLLFALCVFVYIYRITILPGAREHLTFIGLILMMTMIYYEILSIRDEVSAVSRALQKVICEKVFNENKKE